MKIDVALDLLDAFSILENALKARYPGDEIRSVTLTSYDQPKLIFEEHGMVEGIQFRHKLVIPK